ncbi:Histidine kinase-like ATPase domain-containing protein [Lentzea xinjiangensis]|uniref:Histidine kinase-like ATPase domain-containing protein n=1 Tax=Lentzea xinjiangensis TaxID=402600 RepID=A0A1H9K3K5_9PSEU|nr:ATP-binding protein [Lentzea xinjiangensis]SEQ93714.1 Histidine kinase-like ATPase domain-containing protein [Lentzea xinjiangensis]
MTVDDEPAHALVMDFPIGPDLELTDLRREVGAVLHSLGADHCYDVLLVVSELVSNVLDHTRGTGRLRLLHGRAPCEVTIEVDDSSPQHPVKGRSRLGGHRGRGLVMIDNATSEWGSTPAPGGGKTVFAVVPCVTTRSAPGTCR